MNNFDGITYTPLESVCPPKIKGMVKYAFTGHQSLFSFDVYLGDVYSFKIDETSKDTKYITMKVVSIMHGYVKFEEIKE